MAVGDARPRPWRRLRAAAVAAAVVAAAATPLDDYVAAPDDAYAWYDTGIRVPGACYTGYVLNMTSQHWLSAAEWWPAGSAPGTGGGLWWHYITVLVPHARAPGPLGLSVLRVTGGDFSDGVPSDPAGCARARACCLCAFPEWAPIRHMQADTRHGACGRYDNALGGALACGSGRVVSNLFYVPNQPLEFAGDWPAPVSRDEDAILAFCWRHYLNASGAPFEWIPRLPMTKARRALASICIMLACAYPNASACRYAFSYAGSCVPECERMPICIRVCGLVRIHPTASAGGRARHGRGWRVHGEPGGAGV